MHVIICLIYGFTVWISLLAYAAITGASLGTIILAGPFVISGAIAALALLDFALVKIRKLWA